MTSDYLVEQVPTNEVLVLRMSLLRDGTPSHIGRAQYRNSRSRPARSGAATRSPTCTEKPPP